MNGWEAAKKRSEVISIGIGAELARWLVAMLECGEISALCDKPQLCIERLKKVLSSDKSHDEQEASIRRVIVAHFSFDVWKRDIKPRFYDDRRDSTVIRVAKHVRGSLKAFMTERGLKSMSDAIDELLFEVFKRDAVEDLERKITTIDNEKRKTAHQKRQQT